jgi:ATP-dependent Clp protease adaptor protein ClpS
MGQQVALPEIKRRQEEAEEQETTQQPPFKVVLYDDDLHTFEYVIEMMRKVFGYPKARGLEIAMEVHNSGRVVTFVGSKEPAEFYCDSIRAYGPDPRIPRSSGSMSATVEPADA